MTFDKVKLSEVADIIVGFAFKSQDFNTNANGIRLVRGKNITKRSLRWGTDTRWWSDLTLDLEKYYLQPNDIVIGMDGSLVGKNYAKVTESDLPLLLVQRVACIRAKNSISQNYLWQIIANSNFENYIDAVKTGTTIPHISGKQIGDYEIPFCDFPIQQKIAAILSEIEDKIALNTAINENIEQQINGSFMNMFPNVLNDNGVDFLEKIISFSNGKKRPNVKGNIPVFGGNGILAYTDKFNSSNCVIIGRVGAYCGNVSLSLSDCWISDNAISAKSRTTTSQMFIFYLLKNANLSSRHIGTGQPLMTQGILNSIPCNVPPIEEIQKFESNSMPLQLLITANIAENQRLAALRDTLLPKLMNGEIDVSAVRI